MWETRSVFHIPMPRLLRQDGLRCRWPVAQRRVRSLCVIFHAPPLRQNLCLLQRVKDLAVQELVAQLPIEALAVPVLPWTPRLDVQRLRARLTQPLPQLLGNELRPIVRTYVLGYPAHQHHIRQRFDHLQAPQPPRHPICVPKNSYEATKVLPFSATSLSPSRDTRKWLGKVGTKTLY